MCACAFAYVIVCHHIRYMFLKEKNYNIELYIKNLYYVYAASLHTVMQQDNILYSLKITLKHTKHMQRQTNKMIHFYYVEIGKLCKVLCDV